MLALTKTAVIRLRKVFFCCGKWCALFASESGKEEEEKKYEENKTRKDASVTLAGSLHTTLMYILSTLRDHHRRCFCCCSLSPFSLFVDEYDKLSIVTAVVGSETWEFLQCLHLAEVIFFICVYTAMFSFSVFSFSLMHHCTYGYLHFDKCTVITLLITEQKEKKKKRNFTRTT